MQQSFCNSVNTGIRSPVKVPNRCRSVSVEEFGHLGCSGCLAGELVDAESLEDQTQCALVLIKRLRLEIWFAIGADEHRRDLTSAMI